MSAPAPDAVQTDQPPVPFGEALRFWVYLGFINFGGPAGQIATMHKELVDRKRWISEQAYLRALNFCTLLPGPEAQQLATYIGWRLHGIPGGIVAGAFFVIPSIFVLLALSWLSVAHMDVPAIAGLFYGVQAVVIAIVVEAVVRIGKRALKHRALYAFAAAAFIALYGFSIPFPLVIAAAAIAGLLLQRRWPAVFQAQGHGGQGDEAARAADERADAAYPPLTRAVKFIAIFVVLWAIPVGALLAWQGRAHVLVQEALFFTRAAFITFGGAYAVLSYIAKQAVEHYGWLDANQMVQGLGLAETTPGPLIMVTQYVGFVGAWNHGGEPRLLYATLGALITTYATFLPCFLFIFVGAPYIEALASNRRLQAALVAITAAVVGVILNLAVFFARHVLFPDDGGVDWFALMLAIGAFIAAWRYHMPIHSLVLAGAVLGMVWTLAT